MPIDASIITTLGLDQAVAAEVNGRQNGASNNPAWDSAYHPCPEAFADAAVAAGPVHKLSAWDDSLIYADAPRDIWLYNTPGCMPGSAPNLLICNDGGWYLDRNGPVRATRVLDSLFSLGQIKPTVAIFISPGKPGHAVQGPIASYGPQQAQRSLEYDQLTPRYGEFLFTEIIALAQSTLGLAVSQRPEDRLVCGVSSGGIAAFMAAWHYPDQCRRVLSHCGSYTDIWGGHNCPSLVRTNPRKPLRVFLQSGANDVNSPFGDWALANQTMASAFAWAGYDYRFEFGSGGHNLHHGGALFADSLRWLWRD